MDVVSRNLRMTIEMYKALYAVVLVLVMANFVGCHSSSHHPSAKNDPKLHGTGDSAGGNGTNDKVYESYIKDPSKLKEFKPVLELMHKLDEFDIRFDSEKTDSFTWAKFHTTKDWYFAPIKLKPLDNQVVGVSFSDDKTQQLAAQTDAAIWIDAEIWDRMKTAEDKTDLLYHEQVENIYLLKFKTLSELCVLQNKYMSVEFQNCEMLERYSSFAPPEPKRSLNSDDYSNIRSMVSWLKTNAQTATGKEIYRRFLHFGFDQRIFNLEAQKEDEIVITSAEVQTLLENAQLTNHLPDNCYFVSSGKQEKCKLQYDFTKVDFKNSGILLPSIRVSIDKATPQNEEFLFAENYHISSGYSYQSKRSFYVLPVSNLPEKSQPGTKATQIYLIFIRNTDNPLKISDEFYGLIRVPAVLTKQRNGEKEWCVLEPLKATSEADWIFVSTEAKPEVWLAQQLSLVQNLEDCAN